MSERRTLTHKEWLAEAERRLGLDINRWRFVCPSCGYVTSVDRWRLAGAPEGNVAYSCIGRSIGTTKRLGAKVGPCDYAGGGLFRLNPVDVVLENGNTRQTFEFAEEPS